MAAEEKDIAANLDHVTPGLNKPHSETCSIKPADSGKDAWLFLAGSFILEALLWGTLVFG